MHPQRFSYLLFILFASTLLCSCSSVDKSDPKSVLQAFFDKIGKKDIDGAMELATAGSQSTLSLIKMAVNMAQDGNTNAKEDFTQDFKDVILGEPQINGDVATVTLTSKKEQKNIDFTLKKESGGWKVDFSLEALMKMGMKQHGNLNNPALTDDSLPIPQFDDETIKKAMEAADSITKNLDPKKLQELQKEMEKAMEKYKENN